MCYFVFILRSRFNVRLIRKLFNQSERSIFALFYRNYSHTDFLCIEIGITVEQGWQLEWSVPGMGRVREKSILFY